MVVLPKSVTNSRIKSNFQDFELSEADYQEINGMNKRTRYNHPLRWGVDIFGEAGDEGAKQVAKTWADEQLAARKKSA